MLPIIGIIAGSGLLPSELARIYTGHGGKVIIASINDDNNLQSFDSYPCQSFRVGAVGSTIEYFNENNVKKVILIGGIKRPDFASIRADLAGSKLIAKILKHKFLGDDNVLKLVADFLEEKGLQVISPKEILRLGNYERQIKTKTSPTKQDKIDIELGTQILKKLGNVDVGQSIIVENGYVLGIEAAEGTDNLIRRCDLLRKKDKGGILVKTAKSGQDMRLDIPVIGSDTIFYLAKHGFNGLAVQSDGVIIISPEEVKKLLDENSLFIHFI